MASSLSDILSAVQNGVIALNNMAVQIKGSFNNILSRFVTDEANIATNTAAIAVLAAPACFSVNKNATDQIGVVSGVFTTLTFSTEVYDIGSHFAANAWTPPAGKVHFDASVFVTGTVATGAQLALALLKNGTIIRQTDTALSAVFGGGGITLNCDEIAVGTDAYTLQIFITTTAGTGTVNGLTSLTYFMGHWFSA